MQYLLALVVSVMLVTGQSLWKHGVGALYIDQHASFFKKAVIVGFNPYILLGCLVYALATVLYIYVIGRYEYAVSYAIIVSLSLVFASTAAVALFHEKLGFVNIVGMVIIIFGIFLVLKR